jgi:hypothetical protein
MAIKRKVGIEVEYLMLNGKGEVIVPPASFDRDSFPLLGEIRGAPGENAVETMIGFSTAHLQLLGRLYKGHSIVFSEIFRAPLKIYREANRQMKANDKEAAITEAKNIYGTDISEFSDQIIEKGKIQGVNVSCGLHIHFSCEDVSTVEVEIPEFEDVTIPIDLTFCGIPDKASADLKRVAESLIQPVLNLKRLKGYTKKHTLVSRASQITKPVINWIVSEMDKKFFDVFAPEPKNRTKFRKPGFYEIKPYGFEYRSLPASDKSIAALPEITAFAFNLLCELGNL